MKRAGLLLVLALASARGWASDASAVLARMRAAYGAAAWENRSCLLMEGAQAGGGLPGQIRVAVDRASGRFAHRMDFGDYRAADGLDAHGRWRQDGSGGFHSLDSDEARAVAASESWLVRFGFLDRNDGAAWTVAEPVEEQGTQLDRLVATPPGGRAVTLLVDRRSHLVRSAQMQLAAAQFVQRYDGYTSVGGLVLPTRITTIADDANEVVVTAARWSTCLAADPAWFERPGYRAAGDARTVTVPLAPGRRVIVNANIDGKGPFPFVVDTGAQAILTEKAAAALGVSGKRAAAQTGVGGAAIATTSAMVHELNIGGAVLHDVPFQIFPMPAHFSRNEGGPEVVGLLGLEVFEQFAVRFDFANHTATLAPLATYQGELDGSDKLAMHFSDDIPLVSGRINGVAGEFAVDTGNVGVFTVQGRFARAHGLDAAFKGGKQLGVKSGVGTEAVHFEALLDRIELGTALWQRVPGAVAYDEAGPFSSRYEAANIGQQLLKDYVVTFDYRHGTMSLDRPKPAP
ncbi:MAG: aspartyl protease family protein [Telluria sp.]